MNSILEKIESTDSFDQLANLLQSKDLIKQVHTFLHNISDDNISDDNISSDNIHTNDSPSNPTKRQKITKTINTKYSRMFLTAYMISRFPEDTLGSFGETTPEGIKIDLNEQSLSLKKSACDLINYCKYGTTIDMSGDNMSGDNMSGDNMSGDNMSGDNMSGDNMSGDNMSV
jgi:uncharacterized protein YjbI with pentapeptide repeats